MWNGEEANEKQRTKNEAPDDFEFPFVPYDIQRLFMKQLYETIENKKLGIFESPTGTGKSLSIICGALRWLTDHNKNERIELERQTEALKNEKIKNSLEFTDWLTSQCRDIEITHKLNCLQIQQNKMNEYEKKIEELKTKKKVKSKPVWPLATNNYALGVTINTFVREPEDELLLEDTIMFEDKNDDTDDENGLEEQYKYEPVKIIICSRTHSQLSQLVREIQKSPFGNNTRAISMASRQIYCTNPLISSLKFVSLINEKCLDMQDKKKNVKKDPEGKILKRQKNTCQCPYYKQQNVETLRDIALSDIHDIEDLVTQGKQLNACPYYATRSAAEDAQIILVPYNTLLHKSTREANGIKLKNNVVIIDEAHNLLDALTQMYSAEISYVQLENSRQQLNSYKRKYLTRFSAYNLLCINQLLFIIKKLIETLGKSSVKTNDIASDTYTVSNFVSYSEIDNYNIFELLKFCRDNKLAQKLHSFCLYFPLDVEAEIDNSKNSQRSGLQKFLSNIEIKRVDCPPVQPVTDENAVKSLSFSDNSFLIFINFLEVLTYSYDDGRIILYKNENMTENKLKFLLLNSAVQFKDIVKEARSVIVAGGTMKPISEFKNRLFINAGASPDRITEFSCDHIVPPQNILTNIITGGPNHENLLFNFENRFTMGACLKKIIQDVSGKVNGGTVVFFPSYKYEGWFWQQLEGTNLGKPIFREPQDSGKVEMVLNSYAAAIKAKKNGAILFSVVGGKLSEGLNFSDDLGRCVIVVGLPYANINSAELQEKMKYLDEKEGKGAGQKFYEALCMKSVNQCIGRAVRHRNDYACVLLLDVRYNKEYIKAALPNWIKQSLVSSDFSKTLITIERFFAQHE